MRFSFPKALILAGALFLSSHSAKAAKVYVNFGPNGSCAVTINGDIMLGDEIIFDILTPDCRGGGVLLKSDGGSLTAGLRIGELIRERGLETAVTFNARCASACALAWLGGTKRYMSTSSWIGFHAAYTVSDLGAANESGLGNALVGAYMTTLGLPKDAVIFAASARPNEMNWLTAEHALQLGINVVVLSKADYEWIEALDQSDPHRND
jgi:hypothetical protein